MPIQPIPHRRQTAWRSIRVRLATKHAMAIVCV
ncbi:uncharacterized protein METZ01_LOCUS498166, partial [marine metagenome]